MAKSDRLQVAWERRRDVHAWLVENGAASMPEIKRRFGKVHAETVRASVRLLKANGHVRSERVDGRVVLVAVTAEIEPMDAARDRLREIGRAAAPALAEANRSRPRAEDGTFMPGPVVLGPRYTNRPGKKRPIRNQGGQGAGGLWRGGMASCLF